MKKGFSKTYRRELESDIWKMPPIYQRVFFFLRLKVKYKAELFPTRKKCGIWLNPGQWLTSIDQVANGVSWYEWGKEKIPNKKVIKDVLMWLESNGMIVVESNAYGTYIELINWGIYNDIGFEKVTIGGKEKVTSDDQQTKRLVDTVKELKKELKELKEVKEEDIEIRSDLSQREVFFEEFWEAAPARNGKKIDRPAAKKKFLKLKERDLQEVIAAVRNYAKSEMVLKGVGIKDPHRFLSNKDNPNYWKEWIEPEEIVGVELESGSKTGSDMFGGIL